jgi:hypothetical protein
MAEEKEKKPVSPEQKEQRRAVKVLAFNVWRKQWRAANPKASKEERKAAWGAVRGDEIRKARQMMNALKKGGFKIVAEKA